MQRARTDQAKDDRRQALLSAALDEFFDRGFAASRMDDVAKRAGLSKGTVYLYFDSKDALFKALIEQLTSPNIARIEAIAAEAPSIETALERIAAFAPVLIRQSNLPRLMKVLIGDSHLFPDLINTYRKDVLERLLAIVAGVLEKAAARGEIEVQDPHLTARLVMAPVALSGLWEAVFGREASAEVDLETLFKIHASFLLKALRPEGGRSL